MARLIWAMPALSDLEEIADYIAIENPSAAATLVKRVFSTVEQLEQNPKSGKVSAVLQGSRYRELSCGPCRVFYRISQNEVIVLYVMRGERELRNYILDERYSGNS